MPIGMEFESKGRKANFHAKHFSVWRPFSVRRSVNGHSQSEAQWERSLGKARIEFPGPHTAHSLTALRAESALAIENVLIDWLDTCRARWPLRRTTVGVDTIYWQLDTPAVSPLEVRASVRVLPVKRSDGVNQSQLFIHGWMSWTVIEPKCNR